MKVQYEDMPDPVIDGRFLSASAPVLGQSGFIGKIKEVIAVDQDPLGVAGSRVRKDGDAEVWSRPLKGGGRAVILFNRGKEARNIQVTWEQLNYPAGLPTKVRDLWQHKDLSPAKGHVGAVVGGHAVVMLTIKP